jgi:GntR family transcriptional repressor for pyruvate dehydrogenase complex
MSRSTPVNKQKIDSLPISKGNNQLDCSEFTPRLGKVTASSRAVMREAFGALADLKLIDVANGRRARVAALDGSVISASLYHAMSTAQINVADVRDVLRTVGMPTAELAARHATLPQARRIGASRKG